MVVKLEASASPQVTPWKNFAQDIVDGKGLHALKKQLDSFMNKNRRDVRQKYLILLKGCFCFKKLLSRKSLGTSESIHCMPHHSDLPSKSACRH